MSTIQQTFPLISMDDTDLRILESRIPTRTLVLGEENTYTEELQCPLRKGIIYYVQKDMILERNIYSSSNKEPRIVARLQRALNSFTSINCYITPIKHNRILVMVRTWGGAGFLSLHLSIHEIRSCRVGPTLWTYNGKCARTSDGLFWKLMKSTTNNLGITFRGELPESPINLFNVSTEESYPIVEAGRLNYTPDKRGGYHVELSPDRRILLHTGSINPGYEIDVFYSGSSDTNNMDFSLVTHIPIPNPNHLNRKKLLDRVPLLAFSADGSKFATSTDDGIVSVWDVQSKTPLKIISVEVELDDGFISFLQFSSGNIGREALVFMETKKSVDLQIIHLIDATSFEKEDTLHLPFNKGYRILKREKGALFFDPSGRSLYAKIEGTLYEWDLEKNQGPKCEWWLGEE